MAEGGLPPIPQLPQPQAGQQVQMCMNWSHFKPKYSGKPEDVEAHLLRTNDWMTTHDFPDGVKVQRFCLTLMGEARLNVDGRFAQNIEYLFCAQYIADIKQIESDANLAIMLSQGRTLQVQKITAGQLQNPAVLQQLVRNEQAYKFLKNVRGSPAYWQDQLYDVLAML